MSQLAVQSIAIAATIFGLHTCCALPYTVCVSPGGRVHNMSITGCEEVSSCHLRRTTTRILTINFSSHSECQEVTSEVHVKLGWSWLNNYVPVSKSNACGLNLLCPVAQDSSSDFVFNITAYPYIPTFSGVVKWELKNESGVVVACVTFQGAID